MRLSIGESELAAFAKWMADQLMGQHIAEPALVQALERLALTILQSLDKNQQLKG